MKIITIEAAVAYNRQDHEQEDDEQPHIVISQEVPTVLDTFKGNAKRK